jgi:hypothetical protein
MDYGVALAEDMSALSIGHVDTAATAWTMCPITAKNELMGVRVTQEEEAVWTYAIPFH